MSTIIDFAPASNANFTFQATFDGQVYNVIVNWNLFGARYYINIYTTSGALIVCRPLIGSPLGISLASITYENGLAIAVASEPFTYAVGSVVQLTISGATPDGYNGTFNCAIQNDTTFSYALPTVLDQSVNNGNVSWANSMTFGYFDSTLVYLPDNQQIIVSP